MKVIIDTNILVNVLLSPNKESASFKVLELCLMRKIFPQVGHALFCEYEDVFSRVELRIQTRYTDSEIEGILDGFLNVCKWSKVHYLWRPNLKDEGDNHLIDLAVASGAEWIVTQNVRDLNSGDLRFGFKAITALKFLEVYLDGDNNLPDN